MDIQATPADIERLLSQSDWLSALARKLVGDSATADDLVQDTWIAALQNPPDPDRPVRPWLAGILRRVASMRARAEGRRSWRQRRAARKDELPSAASLVGEVDLQQRLSREVLELDEPYRTTLLLRYFHDLPAVEIARRQGIPAGTVRWRLKRGLDDLRGRLDRSFGDRRSWCLALVGLARREPAGTASATGSATTVVASATILAFLGLGTWMLVDRGRSDSPRELPAVASFDPPRDGRAPEPPELAAGQRVAGASTLVPEDALDEILSLRLVEPRGYTTAGLRGVALHADGAVTEVRSDADGTIRFAGRLDGGAGELWIDRPGSFIAPARFEHAAGLQQIRLPDGDELIGRATHGGAPLPEGFFLEIDSDLMLPWGPLPEEVAELLGVGRRARAATDDQGRFVFHSLPADYTGELWLPRGWRFAGQAPAGKDAPRHDRRRVSIDDSSLQLEISRMPAVYGTVQDATGAPAAGVTVQLRMHWTGEARGRMEAVTAADGTFAVELARADLTQLRVSIDHGDGTVRASQRRRPTAPPLGALDLGVLTLSDASPGLLDVRGPAGPLAGAWLYCGGVVHGPSGADGRIAAATSPGRGWIGASGYRPTRVEWDSQGTAEVRLEPMTTVRIQVLDRDGAPVSVVSLSPPRARDDEAPPPRLLELTTEASRIDDGLAVASEEGWFELVDLPTGEALSLPLLDVLGRPLDSVRLSPLATGERREIAHTLAAEPRRLLGLCVEESGEVLLGVLLDFETADGDLRRVRSDTEGRFELVGLAPKTVAVTVGKRGFLSRRVSFTPSELARPQEIRLQRSCDLVVHAVDAHGRPHERLRLDALLGEDRWVGAETAPGVYKLFDLPREPVSIEWSRGAFSGSVEWDPILGPAELEIGPGGGIVRGR